MSIAEINRQSVTPPTRGPCSRAASAHYQALLAALDGLDLDAGPPKVIGLAGCTAGAGVSTIASNLALEIAGGGYEKVLLIDANFQGPKIHRLFSANPAPGLVQALAADMSFDDCVQPSGIELLHLMTSGSSGQRPALRFRAQQFERLLDTARRAFDFIVLDLPAAKKLSMSFSMGGLLDGILLVVEAERNQAEELQRAKRQFIHAHAKLLGVILNKCRREP